MKLPESVMTTASWGGVVLVQVTLVALLGLVAWLLARRRGPALRGAVLFASLVGVLFLPGLARLAPTWLPLPCRTSPGSCTTRCRCTRPSGRHTWSGSPSPHSSASGPFADSRNSA